MGFVERLEQSWPPADWIGTTVLVAVSGGADSIALLRALHLLKSRDGGAGGLVAAHFNHRLRGAESDADQAFVAAVCAELSLSCVTNSARAEPPSVVASPSPPVAVAEVLDDEQPGRAEDAARRARYAFLAAEAGRLGARYVVTAHTADDQAETVLHRILRGTGLEGLAGIPRARPFLPGVTLLRPLLRMTRADVERFLAELGQPFRNDSSNAELGYTRNRLRHDLMPRLERDYNPRVREALTRLAELAAESAEATRASCAELEARAVVRRGEQLLVLNCLELNRAAPYHARQMLVGLWDQVGWPRREMSLARWTELLAVAAGTQAPSRCSLPSSITAERRGAELWLVRAR